MAATAETAAGPRRARAFGLEIELSFEAPGLAAASGPAVGRPVRLDLVPPERIDGDWPAAGAERLLEERFDGVQPDRTIDSHPEAGYRLWARHFGLARLTPSGDRIACSPPDSEPWNWQRFLVGRILPWAAVLRGLEAFHASAVALDGRALAFVGPTGGGKTSLALRLVGRGAGFLTDDVLALEERDGGLLAHPGAGVAAVREAERAAIAPDTWRDLGTVLGESGKTYVELKREDGPVPLGSVYFLRSGDHPPIEPLAAPDPRLLLASTFVLAVRTPERLRNQLEVCAAIARAVPAYWLTVGGGRGADELAALVEEHAHAEATGR